MAVVNSRWHRCGHTGRTESIPAASMWLQNFEHPIKQLELKLEAAAPYIHFFLLNQKD